ncbi:MAG TPA: trypsin-like peptidase domain-containing protein [Gemmatimonadaceae bacterium]|nr:trypsin-like peptidase domain-containing protein [Gemmatimonadaceae bacterium]
MLSHIARMTRVAAVLLLGACVGGESPPDADSGSPFSVAEARASQQTSAPADPRRRTLVTEAVARVAPSVVTVQTQMVARAPVDPYAWFFGGPSGGSPRVTPGLGSGFIVRADGIVVTNAHVIEGASSISVAMSDGTTLPAELLGADEPNDIAVLKIQRNGLPVAALGNSGNLLIGEPAIAIGNPFGFVLGNPEPSVTTGVVSGTGRNLIARTQEGQLYLDMIQTDAAINPGNSGGPLVNVLGEVIGMNSSIFSPSGGSVGIAFAIPIDRVIRVTDDLIAHGVIRRPWTGVKIEQPTGVSPREALSAGVIVSSIVPGSPAADAGIRPGDAIIRAGTRALRSTYDWQAVLLDLRVGEELPLALRRNGREVDVALRVADLPEVSAPRVAVLQELELVTLTPAIRAERGLTTDAGALVVRASDRIASEIGIRPGDVILQVNRVRVERAEDVRRVLDASAGRGIIRVYFERGRRIFMTDFILR